MSDSKNQTNNNFQASLGEEKLQIAPGSSSTMQLMVTNLRDDEEFIEIEVKGIPGEWVELPTPVVRMVGGERRLIEVAIRVPQPPQGRTGQYPLVILLTSQNDPAQSQSINGDLIVAAFQTEGRIGVLLEDTQYAVAPGNSVTVPIMLHNRGLDADVFILGVEGIPTSWISTTDAKTRLEPGEQEEIKITIQPPKTPESSAGRNNFNIRIHSQSHPDQVASARCSLNVAVFSAFSSRLNPPVFNEKESSQIIIQNNGNAPELFQIELKSPNDSHHFDQVIRQSPPSTPAGSQRSRVSYSPIQGPQSLRVNPGESGSFEFRASPRSQPIFGGEYRTPLNVRVSSSSKSESHDGEVIGQGMIPAWMPISVGVIMIVFICVAMFLVVRNRNQNLNATATAQASISQILGVTQTASANQTQAAEIGQEDTDGDGLTNDQEVERGTDPENPDSDGDELLDGQEVNVIGTDPLNVDTDGDGLSDGEEYNRRGTNPINSDTDGDGLPDGLEVEQNTDPFNPDSDEDGLNDSMELDLGTDPLNPDSDNDQLLDGEEDSPCPDPNNPDSDGDGLIDGRDINPCDPDNPSLTETALSGMPTETPQLTPTIGMTETPVPGATATAETDPTATPSQMPDLSGTILFESDRDGNLEIYGLNNVDQSIFRLTNSPGQDTQAMLEPDSLQIVYVTNLDGNNEIMITGINQQEPVNITNNPANDQYPVWSPDGEWIAFTSDRDGNQEIFVMRSDGSELQNITNNDANDFAPTWFEAGGFFGGDQWIAFTTDRDGNQEIYLMSPDGSDLLNLTNNQANDYTPSGANGVDEIAFVSDRDGNPEIYLIDISGGNPTNITNDPAADFEPSIDPTGEWVAFASERTGNLEIFVTRITGDELYNLTQNPALDGNPSWR